MITIAKPEKIAPATKYGGEDRRVPARQRADREVEDTTECTESTSGVAIAGEQQVRDLVVAPLRARRRASPARTCRRRCAAGARARDRAATRDRARRPRYQNSTETVKYVETAAASHGSARLDVAATRP